MLILAARGHFAAKASVPATAITLRPSRSDQFTL